ncbi:MAG: hypothetical protein PHT07_12390 [Paludibacter sp.]|nr:hypothetical protein [Paludibacter sp.]
MKHFILLFLLITLTIFSADNVYSKDKIKQIEIKKLETEIVQSKRELLDIKSRLAIQENINEKTINNISSQLDAASLNITIFGILFGIAAIILGIYVTRIENKVVRMKEESTCLLNETKKNKEEVVSINNLIQKDIYGLYLKIKREETNHILNRLLIVPNDVSNFMDQLLSRELEKEDFKILKDAYLKLLKLPEEQRGKSGFGLTYEGKYKLLFFQHFLDLSIKDEIISRDLIDFYPQGIYCSFENDIIKSTKDLMKVTIESGYRTMTNELNSYIKGLSESNFKNSEIIYKIIFDKLQNRENQFGFFSLLFDDKESRIGKSNYGKLLISTYANTALSDFERLSIDKTHAIIAELDKEEQERKVARTKQQQKK